MRIGILSSNYPPHPGGLEVIVQAVATGLAVRHEVTLLTTAWGGRRGVAEESNVRVHRVPAIHLTESLGLPYPTPVGPGVRAAMAEMRSKEILHANGALYVTSLLAARASRRLGKPFVLTEHVGFVEYKSALVNLIQRIAWRLIGDYVVRSADSLITYNARVLEWLEKRYPQVPVRFVGNGVDGEVFRPLGPESKRRARSELSLPADGKLVLFVGRESEKKNLDAVLGIPRKDFRLVVCGAERQLPDDVLDLGLVPHRRMPLLYGAVDVMVHAATGEGFPVAVQEALAAGLPLVLLWDEGYGGALDREVAATFDRLESLEAKLRQVLTSDELRSELAERGRAWALTKWSWETTVETHLEIYQQTSEKRA